MASKSSLRDLRMSSAMSSLNLNRTRSSLAPSQNLTSSNLRRRKQQEPKIIENDKKLDESSNKKTTTMQQKRNFAAAPSKTLNLINVSAKKDWVAKADEIMKNKEETKKETRRARKRRLWMERTQGGQRKMYPDRQGPRYVGDWANLPDLCLEIIFQYLPFEIKMKTANVCYNWSRIIECSSVWSDFVVHDTCMTASRYNFAGKFYEDVLDHAKASEALHSLAKKIKRLSFLPKRNLHNICSFQTLITKFCQYYGDLGNIRAFCYVFPCDFASRSNEVDIYGTGGSILQEMKNLLVRLPGLKKVELVDLQLDGVDAAHVLDEVSEACFDRVSTLKIVNISRMPLEMLAIAGFVNLKVLIISPANLGEDLVECLGDMKRLRNIQIVTNKYTECIAPPVDYRVWKAVRKVNPRLRVHLVTEGDHKNEITFQPKAPVKSIVYDSPLIRASTFSINVAVDLYRTDLECYAHKQLPRYTTPKSFHDRPDSAYLYLVRQCPYIHTLVIRERISSSTVLLLAYTGKNLRYFHVRRNAIMLKCDWPKSPEWSLDFYKWLRKNSRTYEDMEREVSQIFGFRWYALNDKQFKLTPINLNIPYYYEGFDEADQFV